MSTGDQASPKKKWEEIVSKPERVITEDTVELEDEELSPAIPIQTPFYIDLEQVNKKNTLKES